MTEASFVIPPAHMSQDIEMVDMFVAHQYQSGRRLAREQRPTTGRIVVDH
ncbi:hypothetical protein [Shinella sp.]